MDSSGLSAVCDKDEWFEIGYEMCINNYKMAYNKLRTTRITKDDPVKVLEERGPSFFKQLKWQFLYGYSQEKTPPPLEANPHLLFSH